MDSQHVEIYFNEPLTSASATVLGHYAMSGGFSFTAVALSRDGTLVTLTTNQALTAGNAYTITMTGLAAVSGNQLPASLPLGVTYQTPTGDILLQVWDNLDGNTSVNDLTDPALNPNYPNNPTYTSYLTSFDAPYNTGVSNYGEQIQGYIYPPTTGSYVFWIASDDNSELLLSTNANPVNATEICYVSSWTNHEVWNDYSTQQSASISLVAGQRYYIEALMKQGGGGDNLSVAWQTPGTTFNTSTGTADPGHVSCSVSGGSNVDTTVPAAGQSPRRRDRQQQPDHPDLGPPGTHQRHRPLQHLSQRLAHATSTTTSYTDTSGISVAARYSYQVTAVNYDGVRGREVGRRDGRALPASPAITTPTTTSVQVAVHRARRPRVGTDRRQLLDQQVGVTVTQPFCNRTATPSADHLGVLAPPSIR